MFKNLTPGCVGLSGPSEEVFALAKSVGFEGIDPPMSEPVEHIRALHEEHGMRVGCLALPTNFRTDENTFGEGLGMLPDAASKAAAIGCTRCVTWIGPSSDELPFAENFRRHALRLASVARVLGDNGLRLGLEFVGPKTSWTKGRHPFIHTQGGMLELIEAIGEPNVGLMLDAWHWYTSGGTAADILSLTNDQVVQVHLNDAPAGIPSDEQLDNVRELPGATGVIDLATFLGALKKIEYDGPITPEPFSARLRELPREKIANTVGEAMDRVWV
ncbi:MAG: sugar phosphate isomerase/epimerase [Lentisphaeria bacterium]|nr:sugar phosphate isomerase/epimerase [Lentisphaeria bacterium]